VTKRALPKTVRALAAQGASSVTAISTRAEALLAEIVRKKSAIEEAFYEIGLALRELATKKMYTALGFPSFEALLAARGVMGLSQAKKLIAIVSTMDRDTALGLGVEKAYAALRYTEATPEPDSPAQLLRENPRIGDKPFAALTASELRKATRATKTAVGKAPAKTPEAAAASRAARALQAWARRAGAKKAVAVVKKRTGGWGVVLEVSVEEAGSLVRR
jgi:hypothetical protein